MNFYESYNKYRNFDFDKFNSEVSDKDIVKALHKDNPDEIDYLYLLSGKAENYLEQMAIRAQEITNNYFGKVIFLYSPYCITQNFKCFSLRTLGVSTSFTRRIAKTRCRRL